MTNRVAVLLPVYNEVETVTAAVESILAQEECEDFDLVLSDHQSTDGTLAILREYRETYKGRHTIKLGHCPREVNEDSVRGVHQHLNWLMKQCDNEFFIMSTGDDIEYPLRVGTTMQYYESQGKPGFISSNQDIKKNDGTISQRTVSMGVFRKIPIEDFANFDGSGAWINGSTAWSRALWDRFGPLPSHYANDIVMPFWAALAEDLGGFHIGKPLRLFHMTGDQTGLGARYMVSKDAPTQLQLMELMAYERYAIGRYFRKMLESELDSYTVWLSYMDQESAKRRKGRLEYVHRRLTQDLLRSADNWVHAREGMITKGIAPIHYPN